MHRSKQSPLSPSLPPSPRNARPTTNCLPRRRRDLDLWPFDLILPKLAEQFITHLIQFKLSSFNAMVYGDKMVPTVEFLPYFVSSRPRISALA